MVLKVTRLRSRGFTSRCALPFAPFHFHFHCRFRCHCCSGSFRRAVSVRISNFRKACPNHRRRQASQRRLRIQPTLRHFDRGAKRDHYLQYESPTLSRSLLAPKRPRSLQSGSPPSIPYSHCRYSIHFLIRWAWPHTEPLRWSRLLPPWRSPRSRCAARRPHHPPCANTVAASRAAPEHSSPRDAGRTRSSHSARHRETRPDWPDPDPLRASAPAAPPPIPIRAFRDSQPRAPPARCSDNPAVRRFGRSTSRRSSESSCSRTVTPAISLCMQSFPVGRTNLCLATWPAICLGRSNSHLPLRFNFPASPHTTCRNPAPPAAPPHSFLFPATKNAA